MKEIEFEKGDVVKYDNGTVQLTFTVHAVGEYHLYSTEYNIPIFSKKYCKKEINT